MLKPGCLMIIIFLQSFAFKSISQTLGKHDKINQSAKDLAAVFMNPPESAKPGVLWIWMRSNISIPVISSNF